MSLKQIERTIRAARKWIFKPRFENVNYLLHHLRGEAFSKVPPGIRHLVSVGCAGTWYFDWIQKTYGSVERHTGVEFYSPKPGDLPANVEWIANTAGSMPEIADGVADGVFSGQNLEHLWPEDVVGFYRESHRILRPDGLLVVDSPNRKITTRLNWSHPEHTVEFTPDEAARMTELAGFRVTKVCGLWLCEVPSTRALLPFYKIRRFASWSANRRMAAGWENTDHSFIWWIEARREQRAPDVAGMNQLMQEIWNKAWPERCLRMLSQLSSKSDPADCFRSHGRAGALLYGPYLPLRRGTYHVEFHLRAPASCPRLRATCDVVAGDGSVVLAQQKIDVANPGSDGLRVPITIDVADTTFGVQFRVLAEKKFPLEVVRDVRLQSDGGW